MTWQWPFLDTISRKFTSLINSFFTFYLFWHKILCLIYKSREIGKSTGDNRTKSRQLKNIDIDQFIFKSNNFCGRRFISLFWNRQILPMNEYREDKGGENHPRINSFSRNRNHFISLMSKTWEYEFFILINFQKRKICKERLARFRGELNENLKGEFTVFIKDAICITLSKKIVSLPVGGHLFYYQSRRCTTPKGTVILLSIKVMYYLEVVLPLSSAETIWIFMHRESISMHRKISCIASQYPCIAENHASRVKNSSIAS